MPVQVKATNKARAEFSTRIQRNFTDMPPYLCNVKLLHNFSFVFFISSIKIIRKEVSKKNMCNFISMSIKHPTWNWNGSFSGEQERKKHINMTYHYDLSMSLLSLLYYYSSSALWLVHINPNETNESLWTQMIMLLDKFSTKKEGGQQHQQHTQQFLTWLHS